ncbi:hypothetical protein [Sphingomonas sp. IW22]|uniref:hypothetical protein n=1 Tax=Sphingomonas sp. IW22 TaxID=3242489 RepID=UPI003520DB46
METWKGTHDRPHHRQPPLLPGATLTSRNGRFMAVCPGEVNDGENAPLVLAECIAGDAPRHVPRRRTWQPGEQLRRAA